MEDLSGLGDDFEQVSPDPADEASARARLRWAISGERRHWASGVWVALSAMVVVLAAVGAVALRPLPVEPPVASLLQVADAVATLPATPLAGDRYYLTRSERLVLTTVQAEEPVVSFIQPSQREVWVAADGTTKGSNHLRHPAFPHRRGPDWPSSCPGWLPTTSPATRWSRSTGRRSTSPTPPSGHPTLPDCSRRCWTDSARPTNKPHALRLLRSAVELIRENGADPSLRAAVLRVIAGVPGIQVSGTIRVGHRRL